MSVWETALKVFMKTTITHNEIKDITWLKIGNQEVCSWRILLSINPIRIASESVQSPLNQSPSS